MPCALQSLGPTVRLYSQTKTDWCVRLQFNLELVLLNACAVPHGSPRRSIGCADVTARPAGIVTVHGPRLPACSQSRSTSPGPSGFGPKSVTTTPLRDKRSPAPTAGRSPAGPLKLAASNG